MRWESRNLQELPKFRDGLSYLYLEHARIEQDAQSIAWFDQSGMTAVSASSLGTLLLGPGTSITHAAIKALAENGCSVSWTGQDVTKYYACGTGETRSSEQLQRQATAWADPALHLEVVRRMYGMRFPEILPKELTLQQIRGREGARVRDAYARFSRESGVAWTGRSYKRDEWAASDPINRAISSGNACLYGVAHAAIVSSGYTPGLGFIHVGKQLSFVYDIADLYKMETVIPAAFKAVAASSENPEKRIRSILRDELKEKRTLERIVTDLHSLFANLGQEVPEDPESPESKERFAQDAAAPGDLWDENGPIEGGVSWS
jgi:CRISP-associated protein Cas1